MVSYDKTTREAAAKAGRQLATIAVGGLTFQGGLTPAEQSEFLDLYQKVNKRQINEAASVVASPPAPAAS